MSINLNFHISDFCDLRILNNIFFFVFEACHMFVQGYKKCKQTAAAVAK